jgi:prophage tail gpP-like protein
MAEVIKLYSVKTKATYEVNSVKSYKIETSIDIPADAFEFILGNPGYEVSNVIAAGDKMEFWLNGKLLLEGYIDDIDIEYTLNSNDIRINGRDRISVLLDNDAIPATYNKIGLGDYLKKVLPKYGIAYSCDDNSKIDKITVSPGENEFSVIERLSAEKNLIAIYDVTERKLKCTKRISTTNTPYIFANGRPDSYKIKDCQVTVSADIKSEVTVYGGDFEKTKKIKGFYKDSSLSIKKVRIMNDSDKETVAAANKAAKEEFYDKNKDALSVQLETTTKQVFPINQNAYVQIPKMGFAAHLLIDSVTYTKDISSGTITTLSLKLMPGIKVTYKNNQIPTLPKL